MSIPYKVTVGLRFRQADAPTLHELAKLTQDPHGQSAFEEAARAAENGNPLLVQTMTRDSLDKIIANFIRLGITPLVEDLRLESALRRGPKLRA